MITMAPDEYVKTSRLQTTDTKWWQYNHEWANKRSITYKTQQAILGKVKKKFYWKLWFDYWNEWNSLALSV